MRRPPTGFWCAVGSDQVERLPRPGELVALARAVWRVNYVDQLGPDGALVDLIWIGGHFPAAPEAAGIPLHGSVPVIGSRWWNVFPDDTWPPCSCCGEPQPCSTTRFDAEANAALAKWSAPARP